MEQRTELTVDSSLNLRGRIVPVSLRAVRDDYTGGSYDYLAAWRASTSLGQVLFSAGWEYQRTRYRPAGTAETLTGYLTASTYRSYRWQIIAALPPMPRTRDREDAESFLRRIRDSA